MGNYEQLKAAITAVIKQNGRQEITGDIMQNALLSIISNLGKGATFAGIAYPDTVPGTPDQNLFYLATTPGVYANFDDVEIVLGEFGVIFMEVGGWNLNTTPISIGGILNVNELYNVPNDFTFQQAINAIGAAHRKAGLIITFKESEKIWVYAQYRLTFIGSSSWANIDNWEVIYRTGMNGNRNVVTNLNSINSTGLYSASGSVTNSPIPGASFIWVVDHLEYAEVDEGAYQKAIALGTSEEHIFERRRDGNEWGEWIDNNAVLNASIEELKTGLNDVDNRLGEAEENISNILATNPLQTYAYGVDIDYTVADYARTRIGNLSLHAQLPVQIQMRRCLLLDNGKVNYYLDENNSDLKEDGTPANLTGADGMYMVELPKHYRRFIETGTKMQTYISDLPLPGFHLVPKMYISAVEASIDRTNASLPKLASVVNSSAAFRGGNNTAAWDGTYRTLLGRPGTATSLTNFRAYARRRGNAGINGVGWNAYLDEAHLALYWLYTIEYASTNCQLPFNATPTANGYKQGGLGDGVTNMSDWGGFNGSNPFIPCGTTNSLGNKTGVVIYTTKKEDGTNRDTLPVPAYRGIENPFGHIWKWTDGVKCRIQSNEAGGLSEVYTCDNPANFQDVNYDNYVKMGDIPRTNGYIKRIIGGEHGIIMPAEVGGSSNTYLCDSYLTNIPDTSEDQRGVLLGGSAYDGAGAGLSYAGTANATSRESAAIGSRLCFLP